MSIDRELIGSALPAYDIGAELGQGGMGVVVSGQHRQLDRRVAIKQLPLAFTSDSDARRRFTAEARVLASLDHPHVVPVYDFVERENVCLLVMELLPGGTLRSRVAAAGGVTAPYAVAVSLACLSGLSAAHRRGVLHRDIKPENMLFASSGVLKVTDFGIAKVIGGPGTVLTRAGELIGTPSYIAPEQVRGGQQSPATDVYMVATMLYELLAGVLPFPGGGEEMAILFQHAYEQPVPLSAAAPAVPAPVAAVVMRGLATAPDDRYGTAESFGVALAESAARAWGPGWLSAQPVPIMDAGPIVSAAGRAPVSGSAFRAAPTAQRAGSMAAPDARGAATIPGTAPGTAVTPGTTLIPGAAATPRTAAAPATAGAPGTAEAKPAGAGLLANRRRAITIAAVVVAVIVIAIIAIFALPHLFHVYPSSSGSGRMHALRYATRA